MDSPKRGEIWLVQLDPTRGAEMQKTRPAAIISSDLFEAQPLRIIVPITTWQEKFARWPFMVLIKQSIANGLTRDSAGNTLQVRSIAVERLSKKIGILTDVEIEALATGVAICIDYK